MNITVSNDVQQDYLLRMEGVLKDNGFSATEPRKEVLRALTANGASAAQLSSRLIETLDRATVYRTLSLFEQTGIVNRSSIHDEAFYELSELFQPHHHHASCQQCGRIIDVSSRQLESAITALAKDEGFLAVNHSLEIRGYCVRCQ